MTQIGGNAMRERVVEKKLVQETVSLGGICPKWVAPGIDGVPDRIVLLPQGCMAFIEVKAPGKKVRPLQKAIHKKLRRLGYKVYVIDDVEQIKPMLEEIGGKNE